MAEKKIKDMNKKEMREYLSDRAKRQNEKAKENWETVSCRLPKGTKERISNQGFSVNGYINLLLLADLDRLEGLNAQQMETITEPQETPQTVAEPPKMSEMDKYKGMTAEELQAQLMAARANNEIMKAAERQREVDRISAENWKAENSENGLSPTTSCCDDLLEFD